MSISAVLFVYNEAKRIESTLKCLAWCDEIVVLDRRSEDNTREIAQRYGCKIVDVPSQEFNPKDNELIIANASGEWILSFTASDVIHVALSREIHKLISKSNFQYDVIHVPFRRYILGIETKYSPWYSDLGPFVFRKSVMKINHSSVHEALILDSDRHFKLRLPANQAIYHLTHETIQGMMERHLLYCRAEARGYGDQTSMVPALMSIMSSIYHTIVRRRSFLLGMDGIAMTLAYVSYWILRFLYIWDFKRSGVSAKYAKIRNAHILDFERERMNKV